MSTQKIYEAVVEVCKRRLPAAREHLDVGAGRGELIEILRAAMPMNSSACDFHVERFRASNISCGRVDLNREPLPFECSRFDVVTCLEVVEHLENYRALLRDAYRVSRRGLLVVTTPNVLNLSSRVRYLCSGFANLFGPLPVRNEKRYSTGGHITPVAYFYLAHAFLDAGFEDVQLNVDKVQRSSVMWLAILFPLIAVGWLHFLLRERAKFRTISAENAPYVACHFSWRLFVGRTIIVSAIKGPSD